MKQTYVTRFSVLTLLAALMGSSLLMTSAVHAQSGTEVIYNTKTQTLEADRILLRYTQLWNLYRFRNDPVLSEVEKAEVDALMTASRIPYLHAEIPIDVLKEEIKKNAVELRKRLRAEIKKSEDPYAAQANLEYLDKVLLRGFTTAGQYSKLTKRKFSEEFERVLPAPEFRPTTGRDIFISQ